MSVIMGRDIYTEQNDQHRIYHWSLWTDFLLNVNRIPYSISTISPPSLFIKIIIHLKFRPATATHNFKCVKITHINA